VEKEKCNHVIGLEQEIHYGKESVYLSEYDEDKKEYHKLYWVDFTPYDFCPYCGADISFVFEKNKNNKIGG